MLLVTARKELPECPREIPWSFIAPYEAQVQRNHGQTLEHLAERGGLDPSEIRCAVEGKGLFDERTMSTEWPARSKRDIAWLIAAVSITGEGA